MRLPVALLFILTLQCYLTTVQPYTLPILVGYYIYDLYDTRLDVFNALASQWNVTNPQSTSASRAGYCGSFILLGGTSLLSSNTILTRTYTVLPAHSYISFILRAIDINRWVSSSDNIQLFIDGTLMQTLYPRTDNAASPQSDCGNLDADFVWYDMLGVHAHSASTITLQYVISNSGYSTASYGLHNLNILFRTATPYQTNLQCYNKASGISSPCYSGGQYYNLVGSTGIGACETICDTCFGPGPSNCFGCLQNAFFDGTICQYCDSSCASCSGTAANQCTRCDSTRWFNTDTTSCILKTTSCPSGQYLVQGTLSTDNSCPTCDASCATCSGAGASSCTSCGSSRYLSGSTCVLRTSSCSTGYYLAIGGASTDNSCVACSSTCVTCSGAGANSCTSCSSSKYLSGSTCISRTSSCFDGYYLASGSATTNNGCFICDSSCTTCSAAGMSSCTGCSSSRYLSGSTCVSRTTSCSAGYYLATGSANTDNSCLSCSATCATCSYSGISNCTSCNSDKYLNGSTCVLRTTSCSAGYYLTAGSSTTDNICPVCDSSCTTCSAAGMSSCTGCSSSKYLSNSTCVPRTTLCPSGYYLAAGSSTTDNNCSDCDASCATCSGSGAASCTSCNSTSYLTNTTCTPRKITSCAAGYYLAPGNATTDNICQACSLSCATCSGPGENACRSCMAGYFIKSYTCIQSPVADVQLDNTKRMVAAIVISSVLGTAILVGIILLVKLMRRRSGIASRTPIAKSATSVTPVKAEVHSSDAVAASKDFPIEVTPIDGPHDAQEDL